MQTRSQMSIEDNDVDNISLNSNISHKSDDSDVRAGTYFPRKLCVVR